MTTHEPLSIGAAALLWHGRGWPVIELPPGAKAPPPDGRTGALGLDMSAPEVAVAPWQGNLGVRMPDDVLGLDVDDYAGKPGAKTLAALEARLGPLPPTWRSTNGRPGASGIRLYRVPVGLRWIAGLPGIDIIQRSHRYAVVWPSMHPEGRQYVLVDPWGGDAEGVPQIDELPELPWEWVRELSRATEADVEVASTACTTSAGADFVERYSSAARPSYADVIVGDFRDRVSSGRSRHDSMQHALIWAMESARAGIVSVTGVVNALGAAWIPLHTDRRRAELLSSIRTTEFDAMLRHAIGKALANPQSKIDALADAVLGIPIAPGTPSEPPGMPTSWGLDADEDAEPAGERAPSIWLDWSTFRDRERGERRWLVDRFWPAGRALALWAVAKTGKSEVALWVAVQLALGRDPFTGRRIEPVDVAYFDYEMTEDDLDDRLDDLGLDLDVLDLGRLHYALLPPLHALDGDQGGAEVEAHVLEVGATAVVIDTFGRAVAGDEDSADTVRSFYRHTGSRLKRLGVSYLRTDHGGKTEERGQRGSSAKRDDVDIVWHLKRTQGGALLDCTGSSRVSWVGPKLALDRLVDDEGVVSYRAPIEVEAGDRALTAKIEQLDRLDLDRSLSVRQTADRLRSMGLSVGKTATLTRAIRARREQGNAAPSEGLE